LEKRKYDVRKTIEPIKGKTKTIITHSSLRKPFSFFKIKNNEEMNNAKYAIIRNKIPNGLIIPPIILFFWQ
jgi:hypothetical protein